MKYQQLSALVLAGILTGSGMSLYAQQGSTSVLKQIKAEQGKVAVSFRHQQVSATGLEEQLTQLLDLPSGYSFVAEQQQTDQLGYTHTRYQQYYKGVKIDGGILLVHTKGELLQSINGHVATTNDVSTTAAFDDLKAAQIAQEAIGVKTILRAYPSPLLIVRDGNAYTLAYQVRIDGKTKEGHVVMKHIYIDAQSGAMLQEDNLIAHQDVNAVAHTFLSGTQQIVVDSVGPHYRLMDNQRNIVTLDATGADMNQNAATPEGLFAQAKEYTDTSLVWEEKPAVMSIRLSTINNNSGLFDNIGWSTGAFPVSTVVADNAGTQEVKAWPEVRFNSSWLPIVTRNLFVFTDTAGNTPYTGMFGKLNLISGGVTDTIAFDINAIGMGTFPWSDTANNSGNYVVSKVANPALDAHWGIEQTYDYYQSVFNRTSYDDNGGKVINYVNGIWPTALTQANAAAMPSPYNSMVYGLGDGASTNPFVAIDVTGHEFTHMVVEHNGNNGLRYRGESGALNESFADVFGTCVEFYAKPTTANWTIGEEVYIGNSYMRSMASPKLRQDPDTYGGQYWVDPTNTSSNNDYGGVHTNSSIQNKWFYLLCEGGSGTNDNGYAYNVSAIGMEKAERIAYRNLTQYLTNQSDFMDAYTGSLQAALDLYGNDTTSLEYRMVQEAWFAVGVGGGNNNVGISAVDLMNTAINIYPNPATTEMNIHSDLNKPVAMSMRNVLGQQVMSVQVSNGNNTFNISQLAKGMYTLNFTVEGKTYVHKVAVR